MDQNDRAAIDGLFGKLAVVERQAPPVDAQADAFIAQRLETQPKAPYFMAQTIVVQEHALNEAQARIERLPAGAGPRPLFGGLFGGGAPSARPAAPARRSSSYAAQQAAPQGGGFLAGAAQTAMGVAGGMLLANAISGMLSGDEAMAAEPVEEDPFAGGFDDGGMDEEL